MGNTQNSSKFERFHFWLQQLFKFFYKKYVAFVSSQKNRYFSSPMNNTKVEMFNFPFQYLKIWKIFFYMQYLPLIFTKKICVHNFSSNHTLIILNLKDFLFHSITCFMFCHKECVHCVKSVQIRSYFWSAITPYLGTFHAMVAIRSLQNDR